MLIRQARVVDPTSEYHLKTVDLLLENGIIKAIDAHLDSSDTSVIEGENIVVSPGWVDAFADYREPGYEHKETIATGLDAAAAGGFTRVLVVPNTNPVIDSKSLVQFLVQKSIGHAVNLHPYGALSQGIEGKSLAEMYDMRAHGAIAFTDGWKPLQNAQLLLKALEYVKAFGGVVVQMPVDTALAAGGLMHEGPLSTRLGMAGVPVIAETLMVYRDIELLRYTGSRLHFTGISVKESVALIRRAKAEGLDVTCSVTPYHLALTDEALQTYDSVYKVTPPLRSESDRQALIEGLKDGTIDCIASHHRPQEWDSKAKEFEYAGDGMNVQEITFPIVMEALKDTVPVERLVDALSTAPRRIFGLPKVMIAPGQVAEMTIFTTESSTQVSNSSMRSISRNHPFMDQALKGKVLGIVNGGKSTFNS